MVASTAASGTVGATRSEPAGGAIARGAIVTPRTMGFLRSKT
jgi:hypothetical protein